MARRLARDDLQLFSLTGATRTAKVKASLFGAVVALALTPAEGNVPTWVQVCAEATYKGHPKADKLVWDRAFFEKVVANFHAHPWYQAGQDGIGVKRVVPYDFEHASEMPPTAGSIPQQGAPAAGWILELSIRDGKDGSAELWALSDFRADVREQIQAGGYLSTSVAINPNGVHPVTGEKVGPVLSSVALTNHPFVQGMDQIAATLEQFGPAETNEEALVGLRRIFELVADADPTLVVKQIQALRTAIAGGTVPESVDLKYLLEQIRRLLSLGLMATTDEILGGAEAAANGSAPSSSGQTPGQEQSTMAGILTTLAVLLSCAENESAIITAAKETKAAADKAEAAEVATDAIAKLKSLFGAGEMQELIAKATKAIADAEALKGTVEALAAAQAALKGGAEQDAANEAQAVAASLARGDAKLAERLQPGILASRTACINADGTVDPVKLDKFRKDFPLEEAQRALLSQRIVAGPNGQQLGGAVTGYRTEPITASAPAAGSANPTELDKLVAEVNAQPGRNPIEKCDALLCSRSAAFKAKPWGERVQLADVFSRKLLAGEMPVIPA